MMVFVGKVSKYGQKRVTLLAKREVQSITFILHYGKKRIANSKGSLPA
jgi:hypothetical protein